jgi:NAD(P)-dependent dehydrogenase (short-subunit alcohol dehydrogenase family)
MRFTGQTAIVTGGASGIGLATALRLAGEGATVFIADLREPAELSSLPGDLRFERCDVTSAADVQALVEAALAHGGRLDVLVHSAGIAATGTVVETAEEDWDRVMAVNLKGAFLCARAAIAHMREHGGGAVVLVASEEGLIGGGGAAAYCTSKGGVIQLTRAMAVDHAGEGVRVNCVCPGPVDTQLLHDFYDAGTQPDEVARSASRHTLLGRLAQPDEIAGLIAFAASPDASYLVGSVLVADGGVTAQ